MQIVMKPIHKFNGGRGATLCHKCSVIISEGLAEDLYCEKCEQKQHLVDMMQEDEKLGLYELKQTAVEWLEKQLDIVDAYKIKVKRIIEYAKEMEKQQIIDAIERGFDEGCFFMDSGKTEIKNGEHYYNKTFNK